MLPTLKNLADVQTRLTPQLNQHTGIGIATVLDHQTTSPKTLPSQILHSVLTAAMYTHVAFHKLNLLLKQPVLQTQLDKAAVAQIKLTLQLNQHTGIGTVTAPDLTLELSRISHTPTRLIVSTALVKLHAVLPKIKSLLRSMLSHVMHLYHNLNTVDAQIKQTPQLSQLTGTGIATALEQQPMSPRTSLSLTPVASQVVLQHHVV